jgi:uncharacterized membrane protein
VADELGLDAPAIRALPTMNAIILTGPERTFGQDPLFAFRLLADIAMRALSPAVNDPATAVQVLDTVASLLQSLVSRDLDVADVADDAGIVRVVLALPSWDDYLRIGLDDLLLPGASAFSHPDARRSHNRRFRVII